MSHAPKMFGCEACGCHDKGIFCSLEKAALSEVSHNKIMNTYKKGQTIFLQGNSPTGLYCINSGKIKVSKISNEGKEAIIRIAGPGDVLGHRSLFSNENYGATATVIEDSVVCFLEKKYINETLHNEPSIALNLIKKLSESMGEAEERTASLTQKNVRERLAELLLNLKQDYGVEEHGRWKIDIKLTREEIASLVGTANETIIRFISEFKDDKLIAQEGKTLYLLDVPGLTKLANLTR